MNRSVLRDKCLLAAARREGRNTHVLYGPFDQRMRRVRFSGYFIVGGHIHPFTVSAGANKCSSAALRTVHDAHKSAWPHHRWDSF